MTDLAPLPLSVLDIMPVDVESTPSGVLRATLEQARYVEELGFTRYWIAEHHNSPNIASSSPTVTAAAVGGATTRLRVGTGGVMLPNHAPFVVAEQFGTLSALYPGRVDLGVGRTPPHDPGVARALRVDALALDFEQQFAELLGFLRADFPAGHPLQKVAANPPLTGKPSLWVLGSSENGARMAAHRGLPFAHAHHFSPQNSVAALRTYHREFRPSEYLSSPYSIIAAGVTVADTDEEARFRNVPAALALLKSLTGPPEPFPTPEQAAAHPWTAEEAAWRDQFLAPQVAGGPDRVRAQLADLLERTGAEELMVVSMVTDPAARRRSITGLRELFGSAPLPQGLAL
ncbi:Limonene 1,2-monooxygenase [Actinomadura rubteroloni]|uniref:Limonene 1,2-monooxygenase n=1 Tax=Actinomadura rubteroloni TaxID=1926885 RepID=A0A2P4UBV0_9ACTN|nr:LLM class flavin-dependent oxidoreductase [Actinomadura rubteroloni]POM22531.1 Limonene 1,2-monooxygenase [Actinomadura rubteroloni]